jgi:acetyltransferase EpsM
VEQGARIGRHCIINTGATVDSDCAIGDFCHVGPGCSLGCQVILEDGVFMGIGSIATRKNKVGAWTTVGAGAVVAADLPDHILAIGVPARVHRTLDLRFDA